MKLLLLLPLLLVLFFFIPQSSDAHRDGCHSQHSCPSDSGSYVCGDKGNYSECPRYSTPKSNPEPPKYSPSPIPIYSKPIPTENENEKVKISLKEQLRIGVEISNIECTNPEHVLVERSMDKFACVSEKTAEKKNWKII